MKPHLRKAAAFIAFIAVFLALNDACVFGFRILNQSNRASKALRKLRKDPERYDMLIIGDSRSLLGCDMDAPVFRRALNLSDLGDDYMVGYYKLRDAVRVAPQAIDVVVLAIGRHSFSRGRANLGANPFHSANIDYWDAMLTRGAYGKRLREWLEYKVFPYKNLPSHVETLFHHKGRRAKREEEGWSFAESTNKEEQAQTRVLSHVKSQARQEWWHPEERWYFRRILSFCSEREIRVVGVVFPVSRAYYDAVNPFIPEEAFDEELGNLLADRPGLIYLDYETLFLDRDELLGDVDHLNPEGARILSERIQEDFEAHGLQLSKIPDRLAGKTTARRGLQECY